MELNLETIEKLDRQALIQLINGWITQDFKKLLLVLYRLDVSEKKLSQLLAENKGIDAANIIATLIIERIAAAKASREKYKMDPSSIPEDEKW
jgi:hypothetical protein